MARRDREARRLGGGAVMRGANPKPPTHPSTSIDFAIKVRVDRIIPSRQAAARESILLMLREEFGTPLNITGEAARGRAVEMIRNFKMSS